jgi:hypothetical protein
MGAWQFDKWFLPRPDLMIEDAREFLKNLAADGLDAYIDTVWQMREPVAPKPSSKTGWPIMTSSARMDYEGRLGLMPRKNLKVLK